MDPANGPGPVADRIALKGRTLRQHTARGTIINAAFAVGLAGVGLLRQLAIAALLTTSEFGLWGVILISVMALAFLLDMGVGEKFVQQAQQDQEVAFQEAFTINLVWRSGFYFVVLASIPVFEWIYGRSDLLLPGAVLALATIGSALQAPAWIFFRQMRFLQERLLQSVEPVVGLVVTIGLAVAGAGVWSLIIGVVVGQWAAGLVALKLCPYPIGLRFNASRMREYFTFSWPLVLAAGAGTVTVQVAVIVGEAELGLAGVGAIGLAATISRFSDRVDGILTQTIYPAIAAVRDRTDLLFESFTKSNRLALMWAVPFGLGLALFAADLVEYVLGQKWEFAVGLLQIFGVLAAARQIGFNWTAYYRARGDTRPILVDAVLKSIAFVAVGVPLMFSDGLTGYGIGMCAALAVGLLVRGYYLARLFGGFPLWRHGVRAVAPIIPAVAFVLALRLIEPAERTPALVLAELTAYAFLTALATWLAERDLLREMRGYLRGRPKAAQPA
jgi:PST family polysaccharide transporter